MIIPYLPKRKGEIGSNPRQRGTWEQNDRLLRELPDDLAIEGSVETEVLTAIPTVWARPLLFAEALFDENHPLHRDVENEWRGILGTVALAGSYHLNLRAKKLDIGSAPSNALTRTLMALLPNKSWNTIWLLHVNDRLVAGTSPSSLFFTPAELCPLPEVPWASPDGRLTDPVKFFQSRGAQSWSHELSILRGWIDKVIIDLATGEFPVESPQRDPLLGLLRKWTESFPTEAGASKQIVLGDPRIPVAPYLCVSRSVQSADGEHENVGEFTLDCQLARDSAPIICTESLWKEPHRKVWGALSPDLVPFPDLPKVEPLVQGKIPRAGIRPERFFLTEKLLRMPTREENCLLHQSEGFVPPLTKEILTYFRGEDLVQLFEWHVQGDQVEVALKLPLRSRGAERRSETIRRVYEREDIIPFKVPPELVLWPNFIATDWNRYYCVAQKLDPDTARKSGNLSFEPYCRGSASTGKFERGDSTAWLLDSCIEGIECLLDKKPAGLIIPRAPLTISEGGGSWTVSVDFGTSNTCVFRKSGQNGQLEPIFFQNRCIPLTNTPLADSMFWLLTHFLPAPHSGKSEMGRMFSSHFASFAENIALPLPVLHGIVLFDEATFWHGALEGRRVLENLKWSMDPDQRKLIQTFLDQVLLMVSAEARSAKVTRLDLKWSYPQAFAPKMINDIELAWQSFRSNYGASGTGIVIESQLGETESSAVCSYMVGQELAKPAATERAQIIVDVGGGTSDIAVWLRNRIVRQSSVLLAGYELSKYAGKAPQLAKRIASIIGVPRTEALILERPGATLNIVLKIYESQISRALVAERPRQEFKIARTVIFCTFAAMFHYLGLLLKLVSRANALTGADVFLAGNGAKLISWVSGEEAVRGALRRVMLKSAQPLQMESIGIELMPKHPKEEVARGLLHGGQYEKTPTTSKNIMAEAGYKVGDTEGELAWDADLLESIDIASLEVPSSFPEFTKFVGAFDQEAEDLNVERLGNLIDQGALKAGMEECVNRLAKLKKGGMALVQPFFVEEVKWILNRLIEANRRGESKK